MTEGDSPLAKILRDVLANTVDPLHSQTCDLQILFRSLHQMTDVEESRMLKTAESVARDKSIKSLNRAEVSAGSSSLSSEKIDLDPDEISQSRVALTNAAQQNHLPSFLPHLHSLLEHPTVASGTFFSLDRSVAKLIALCQNPALATDDAYSDSDDFDFRYTSRRPRHQSRWRCL